MFPLCRSITGDGLRETLRLRRPRRAARDRRDADRDARSRLDRSRTSGTSAAAWIEAPDGDRVVDFADSNLHVLNYSAPVDATVSLDELREHVFTHPDDPDLVPYRTSYYVERWGFCMSARQLDALAPGDYQRRRRLDARAGIGQLRRGRRSPGATDDEVLLTTYACHPSLANDNLSGVALLAEIGRALAAQPALRYTYRLLWAPGTIGSICWLARNRDTVERIRHGLVALLRRRSRARSRTSGAVAVTPRSTGWWLTSCGPTRGTASSTGSRTAATSVSSARPGSTCRRSLLPHAGRPVPRVPLVGGRSRLRASRAPRGQLRDAPRRDRRASSRTPRTRTSARTASRSSAGAGCTAASVAARARRWRCSGC